MNRRDFFNYCKIVTGAAASVPILNSSLCASEDRQVFPIDSLFTGNTAISKSDIFIPDEEKSDFASVRKKLKLIQRYVGYGNFNVISFDDLVTIGKRARNIKRFTKSELDFLENTFYTNPSQYGFYGEKITQNLTDRINRKDIIKIPRTGHFLFRGKPEQTYHEMQRDIGDTMTLTSGVRSVVKQMKLYLDKIYTTDGNITKASKSLAPPAYTYHSIADFDVGKKGLGYDNFTARFALTKEFSKMRKLPYIEMRYTINNKDGVRYEPWHIKVI